MIAPCLCHQATCALITTKNHGGDDEYGADFAVAGAKKATTFAVRAKTPQHPILRLLSSNFTQNRHFFSWASRNSCGGIQHS
jgi:hypothetical protein